MAVRLPFTITEVDQALVHKGGLYQFVKLAWPHVEPAPFVDSRHIELVCAHLEAVSRGECRRLVINIPPGCSKSLLVSVFWPAWDWIRHGARRYMNASFDLGLSLRDAERLRDLIESDWYQERFGYRADRRELDRLGWKPVALRGGPRSAKARYYYRTDQGGERFSTMVRGKATGRHCNFQVMDDPTKPSDVQAGGDTARNALEKTRTTWSGTFASRKADPKTFARVVVMQRLHEYDLSATCAAEGYTVLCLPMEYDPARHCKTQWGEDWRKAEGELLTPGRFDRDTVEQTKIDLGPRAYAAQYQQNPTSDNGAVFDRAWFSRRWDAIPAGAVWWQSWDCTFKDTAGADFVVGQTWASHGVNYYLVDQVRARMSFTATCRAVRDMTAKWPEARRVLIEDKANGSAVIDTLKETIPGLIAVEPLGGKVVRAVATTGLWQSGQVHLPEAAWVSDFVEEHCSFPLGQHDDQVDATSQALSNGKTRTRRANRYSTLTAPVVGARLRVRCANPRELESTLRMILALGKVTVDDAGDGTCLVSVAGDTGLARYAIERQGYGKVLG